MARINGPIFVGSYSALKKELIVHFSGFLANCLGCHQNFEGQKMQISSFSLIGSCKSLCIVPKVLFLHYQNFLRRKYDDKCSIFGCEYVTLETIYLLNGSYKWSNFCGIIFSFEKGANCAFFGIFS
jgi:hypothetical protein